VKALRKYASDVIKQNYTISSSAITQDMLDKAKLILDDLNRLADSYETNGWNNGVNEFNNMLESLFRTIPRKMNKVSNFIL
jgi:hypothetical protein